MRSADENNPSPLGAEEPAAEIADSTEGHADGDGPEEPVAEPSSVSVEADLDELLAQAQRERDEYLELAQRARADFENFRRRAVQQAADAEVRGKAELAKSLIPVLDNLERALLAAGIPVGPEERDREGAEQPSEEVSAHEALARGVAMVHGDLHATLASAGVVAFDPLGDQFDPSLHEALSTRPATDDDPGTVVETLEKGYRLDGRVLRAARVVVSA